MNTAFLCMELKHFSRVTWSSLDYIIRVCQIYLNFDSTSIVAYFLEPFRRGSLHFTTQFLEIPGTHFIDLKRMKGWVDRGATQLVLITETMSWDSRALTARPLHHYKSVGFATEYVKSSWSCRLNRQYHISRFYNQVVKLRLMISENDKLSN